MYRTGAFSDYLLNCRYLIRGSSVVLAELARGVRTKEDAEFLEDLTLRLQLVTPTERDWLRSGEVVRRLSSAHDYDVHKTREIHFDVLIALSARRIGAAVITANRVDFERIQRYVKFTLVAPTFPSKRRSKSLYGCNA